MPLAIGVLALQGDFRKHLETLASIGVAGREVRTPEDLKQCEKLIIPGGESTTLGILIGLAGLDKAINQRAANGMPIWGTCMGMILLAKQIEDREQFRFGLLDVTVRRNAFGAQVHSFERDIEFKGLETPFHAVFIRAPEVIRLGEGVEKLSETDGRIIAVRQGALLGTSFHPELTNDPRLHEMFLTIG